MRFRRSLMLPRRLARTGIGAVLGAALLAACSANADSTATAVDPVNLTPAELAAAPPAEQGPLEPPAAAPGGDPLPALANGGAPADPVEPAAQQLATSHVPLKYLIGDVDPANDPKFARIPEKYLGGTRVWGHKDAVEAFIRMAEDADSNGYELKIVSAFRSFSDQKKIWEDKWTGKTLVGGKNLAKTLPDAKARARKILEFSSMPGTSRHHWGTDFDLNALDNKFFTSTRDGKRIYDWLTTHAANYGFCQVYSAKGEGGRATGYEEEKWHWSYRPVASWYLKQYPVDVGYERLTGFAGSEAASQIDVIPNYVQGINPECVQ